MAPHPNRRYVAIDPVDDSNCLTFTHFGNAGTDYQNWQSYLENRGRPATWWRNVHVVLRRFQLVVGLLVHSIRHYGPVFLVIRRHNCRGFRPDRNLTWLVREAIEIVLFLIDLTLFNSTGWWRDGLFMSSDARTTPHATRSNRSSWGRTCCATSTKKWTLA